MKTSKNSTSAGTTIVLALGIILVVLAVMSHLHIDSMSPAIARGQTTESLYLKILLYQGMIRTYWVYVPSSYDGSRQIPLVLGLHGAGENGYVFAVASGWTNLSEENGFILACPSGSTPYSAGFRWNIYNWTDPPDDVGFLMTLIGQLKSDYPIDSSRIYMTGYSNGASMTNTFAFKYADVLAAAAPVSGRWMTALGVDPYSISQPNASLPVYIWRGELETSQNGFETREVQDQLQKQYWIDWNKLDKAATYVTAGIYKTEIYSGSQGEVRFTEVEGRSHNTYDPDTTAKIWKDFFTRFRREANGRVRVISSADMTLWMYLAILLAIFAVIGVGVAVAIRKSHKPKLDTSHLEMTIICQYKS